MQRCLLQFSVSQRDRDSDLPPIPESNILELEQVSSRESFTYFPVLGNSARRGGAARGLGGLGPGTGPPERPLGRWPGTRATVTAVSTVSEVD